VLGWMKAQVESLATTDELGAAKKGVLQVAVKAVAVSGGIATPAQDANYAIGASEIDIDRLFEDAGRSLGNGLHKDYWRDQEERDATDVKVEVVALSGNHAAMAAIEKLAEQSFNKLYDDYKGVIGKLGEAHRARYERLRLAAAKPSEIPWHVARRRTCGFKRHRLVTESAT